jgi:hypothetical protein
MGRKALEHRVRAPRLVPGRFEQMDRAVDRLANGLARPGGLIEGAMEDVPIPQPERSRAWALPLLFPDAAALLFICTVAYQGHWVK